MLSDLKKPVQSPKPLTGFGNTRLNQPAQSPFEVGLDYLTFQGVHSDFLPICEYLNSLFENQADLLADPDCRIPFEGLLWSHKVSYLNGIAVCWRESDRLARVVIPGQPLRAIAFEDQIAICMHFQQVLNMACRRVDPYIRDYSKSYIDIELFAEAAEARNYTNYRSAEVKVYSGPNGVNKSPYFGSRESLFMLRIYDESLKTKGAYDCHKFEGETKRELATSFVNQLIEKPDIPSMQRFIVNFLVGRGGFYDRTPKCGNRLDVNRSTILPFWQRLLDALQASPIRFTVPRPQATINRVANFFTRQVASSLYVMHSLLGDRFNDYVSNLVRLGGKKASSAHRRLLRQSISEKEEYDSGRLYEQDSTWVDKFVKELLYPIPFVNLSPPSHFSPPPTTSCESP
jgi:hypothetical protein